LCISAYKQGGFTISSPHRTAQRETYRNDSAAGAGVTRFLPAVPDGPGPMIYWDSDGRVDVDFPDRTGRPWFLCRIREGQRQFDCPLVDSTLAAGRRFGGRSSTASGRLARAEAWP